MCQSLYMIGSLVSQVDYTSVLLYIIIGYVTAAHVTWHKSHFFFFLLHAL